MKKSISFRRKYLEHDGAPARAVSMTCAVLATGGMLAFFLGIVPGSISPKRSAAFHHGGSVMVVRLVADTEVRTQSLPVPPEPTAPRKAHRAPAQAHAIEASDNRDDDAAQVASFGDVRCPFGRAAVAHAVAVSTRRRNAAVALDEGNTAVQDAAFEEVRCQFGMRAITRGEHS